MKLPAALLIVLAITFSDPLFACDCDSAGEFLVVAPQTELVALVKVLKYLTFKDIYGEPTPMSMEVEITDVYKGKERRKIVTVWGDNGSQCRPYLNRFEVGSSYVIAFIHNYTIKTDSPQGEPAKVVMREDIGEYAISNCGNYWLNVDKDLKNAVGAVTKDEQSIPLVKLKGWFVK